MGLFIFKTEAATGYVTDRGGFLRVKHSLSTATDHIRIQENSTDWQQATEGGYYISNSVKSYQARSPRLSRTHTRPNAADLTN